MERIVMNFTGQRPKDLYGYNREAYVDVVRMISSLLIDIHRSLCESLNDNVELEVLTGGAQGVDQCAFWAVNNLIASGRTEFINHLYVPFTNSEHFKKKGLKSFALDKRLVPLDPKVPEDKELIDLITGQEARWKTDGVFSQREYQLMFDFATYVTCCEINYFYDAHIIAKMLNDRNRYMVQPSILTVAITKSDFVVPTKGSGTWNCMRDALDQENAVVLIRLPKDYTKIQSDIVYQKYNYQKHDWDTCQKQQLSYVNERR